MNVICRAVICKLLREPRLYGKSTRVIVKEALEQLKPAYPALNQYHVWGNLSHILRNPSYYHDVGFRVRSRGYSVIGID